MQKLNTSLDHRIVILKISPENSQQQDLWNVQNKWRHPIQKGNPKATGLSVRCEESVQEALWKPAESSPLWSANSRPHFHLSHLEEIKRQWLWNSAHTVSARDLAHVPLEGASVSPCYLSNSLPENPMESSHFWSTQRLLPLEPEWSPRRGTQISRYFLSFVILACCHIIRLLVQREKDHHGPTLSPRPLVTR